MPWIRLEAANGLRIMAPSFSPPPSMEGIDRLFDYPLHVRSFHCFRSRAVTVARGVDSDMSANCMEEEEIIVLVQQQQIGGKLGEVTIAVGGPAASREELTVVLDSAFEAIRRTNYSGARLILDALCTSADSAPTATDEVIEYDGLPTAQESSRWEERRVSDWRASDDMSINPTQRSALHPSVLLRRRALLFFVAQDIIPVNLLYCRVTGVKSNECVPSVASIANSSQHNRKELQSLENSAARACKCLVDVINRTLVAAFGVKDSDTQHHSLWRGRFDQLPFVAVFSLGGLLCASPLFFQLTEHRDRLLIAAVAMDQLCRWPMERHSSEQSPLMHVCELLLKCGKNEVVLHLIFLCVGNAVCSVFAFRTADEGTLWDAARLLRFINEQLTTERTALIPDVDKENSGVEGREFGPHLLLCTASIYPTPWFHRLVYEMNKLEEETPKTVLLEKNGTPKKGLPPKLQGSCGCFPLFGQRGRESAAPTAFVWYTDTVDLPLDVAWCVAASHVVKAEANACSKGRELGHYALFSILSSGTDNAGETGRYGVGWFQHCWRRTLNLQSRNGDNKKNSSSSNSHAADPTKFLGGFSSIGAGPRAPVLYEMRERSNGWFHKGPQLEARAGDNAPMFTSHMMTFPYSLLFEEEDETEEDTLADDVYNAPQMTALYTMATHKVKGVACAALLQEMLLMEGDLTDCEEELIATLQRQRTKSGNEAFLSCHEAANCVLEDIWRDSNA